MESDENAETAPTSSGWDICLIFPCGTDSKLKKDMKNNTVVEFQRVMLGLRVEKQPFKKEVFEVQNKTFQVLKTRRCFLRDDGDVHIEEVDHNQVDADKLQRAEAKQTEQMKKHLTEEYKAFIGNLEATTTRRFHELVASAIVRRLQLSCGLTTCMKRSVDGDEVICVIRADCKDLMTEADRTGYKLQIYNQPFSQAAAQGVKGFTGRQYDACRQLLRQRCGPDSVKEEPQVDPAMFRDAWHPKLKRYLAWNGHDEENCNDMDAVYIAPYAEYKLDSKFQPLFRRWKTRLPDGNTATSIFRPVDRIRLVNFIIGRHLNLEALQFAKMLVLNGNYALHDQTELAWFRKEWALSKLCDLRAQPLMRIRNYFGEKISLYFAWLEFYTKMLRFPALAGVTCFAVEIALGRLPATFMITFAVGVSFWATAFSEMWHRKNAFLNLWWGTVGFKQAERERPQFVGKVRYNPINDAKEMYHPSVKKLRKRMFQASIVVFITISIAVFATIACLGLKAYMVENKVPYGKQGAGVANAVQIAVLNGLYRGVATKLTNYENHRTDSLHENNLIIKTFLFRFFNSYASFFYIAFLKKPLEVAGCLDQDCMGELRIQLGSIFVSQLIAGNASELIGPIVKAKLRVRGDNAHAQKEAKRNAPGRKAQSVEEMVEHFESPEMESKYEPYGDREAFDDNAEMVLQFGYVTLFVVAFPLTPFLAWGSNVVEQHIDAYKLCFDHKRPNPKQAESIGMWQYFLSLISRISVITNIAIVFFTTDLFDDHSTVFRWLMFVVTEHVLLFAKGVVEDAVPDTPVQIDELGFRHEHLVKKVFQGLQGPSCEDIVEDAEDLDTAIHDNEHRMVLASEHRNTVGLDAGGTLNALHGDGDGDHDVTDPAQGADFSGYLTKQPKAHGKWARVFAVLHTTQLTYLSSHTGGRVLGVTRVGTVLETSVFRGEKKLCLELDAGTKAFADSDSDTKAWIQAIKRQLKLKARRGSLVFAEPEETGGAICI